MKSIIVELNQNIRQQDKEDAEKRSAIACYFSKGERLLKESLEAQGYDPSTIGIIQDKVLIKKGETTVRFTLTPRNFEIKSHIIEETLGRGPQILIHIFKDGTSSICQQSLIKALEILVRPDYWRERKGGRR